MIQINTLHPAIRTMAMRLLELAKEAGIDARITFGVRSFETQDALYNQPHDGKDNDGDGKIDEADEKVTQAKAGQSFHNYGLAIDVVPFVNNKPIWDASNSLYKKLGEIGKSVGFEWGGDWKFKDVPHHQFPKNTKYTVLLALKNAGKVDKDGFIIL